MPSRPIRATSGFVGAPSGTGRTVRDSGQASEHRKDHDHGRSGRAGTVTVELARETVRIYLAGSVPKGVADDRPSDAFWTHEDESAIRRVLGRLDTQLLNPNASGVNRADFFANFGCDLALVESSDVVFVDGRAKRGIGVGAEMMFAAMRGIHVIAVCPRETTYRRRLDDLFGEDIDEWIHPFIYGLADHVASSVEEAASWVSGWATAGRPHKTPDDMSAAIRYYEQVSLEAGESTRRASVRSLQPEPAGIRRASS